ncbi:MAG: cbb3-type cytochrome oxidase assembly protein CcoS [bacterium]|nr:cbb3-type cytochrome oxidase assembly protein CcoS [bacterium]
MYVIIILIGASLLVAIGFLFAFWWAVRSGQYEDTYTPAIRMLFEDKSVPTDTENNMKPSSEI